MKKVEIQGYTVMEDGTVLGKRGNPLTFTLTSKGYPLTQVLWNGKWRTKTQHQIVCEAFHGERPKDHEVGHLDANKENNHKDNLKWMTKTENRKQMYQDGRDVSGVKNANNKYSETKIREVCSMLEGGSSVTLISKLLKIGRCTVNNIKHKRQWTDISKEYSF